MIKFNGGIEITIKDLLSLAIILSTIIWTLAILPQQVISECNVRYASRERVDALREDVAYIRSRIDRIFENYGYNK